MRLRPVLPSAIALGLATLLPAAVAAPVKPACNLLADEGGDAGWSAAGVVSSDPLDIVTGDIATGAKEMVGVLRLKSLDFTRPSLKEIGFSWTLGTTAKGTDYVFSARRAAGTSGNFTHELRVGGVVVPNVAFKVNGNNLEWRVPRATIKSLGAPKLVFNEFRGTSSAMSQSADSALTQKSSYPDRYPSCVKAA